MMPQQICFNPEAQAAMRRFWTHVLWLWEAGFVPEEVRQRCFRASDGEQLSEALLARTPDEQEFLFGILEGEIQGRKGANQ